MTLDLFPLLSSFIFVAIAELGDKTQIAVICLSAKHKPKSVFVGAMLAFALIDGVSALIGGAVAPFIPQFYINLAGGIVFIAFGTYTLLSKEEKVINIKEHSKTVTTSFLLISVMELGDKTQFAVIALAAEYDAIIQVLTGVMLAFILLTVVAAVSGSYISKYVSSRYTRIGATIIFLLFGIIFLIQAGTGFKIL